MSRYFEKRFFTDKNEDQSFVIASVKPGKATKDEIKPGSLYLSIHDGDRNNLIIETSATDDRLKTKMRTLTLLKSVIDEALISFQDELDHLPDWEKKVAALEDEFLNAVRLTDDKEIN